MPSAPLRGGMFDKVLIANRGEIARRVIRTCKRMGIATVAVYSDADEAGRHVALAAGTAPVPGTDAPIAADDPEAAKREANRIGYPIVIKAVGGGGGIGMQVVKEEAALERALKSASDRGAQAFGDARIYME